MTTSSTSREALAQQRRRHAEGIAGAGGIEPALASGALPKRIDTTLSEALVLGLLRQGVRTFVGVLGHGSTEIGEVLRIYAGAGLVRMVNVRHEGEASHAAAALRWVTGEKAAVVTSIGPGALHALAASLVPASDGLGVWYLFGDETTEDEGPNMQQIPKAEQGLYLNLCATMGRAYTLHTPLALPTALRRGLNTVDHPHQAGPFFLLLPMNVQPTPLAGFNLDELPVGAPPPLGEAADDGAYARAAEAVLAAERVVVRVGGGAREATAELLELLELADAVAVVSPVASGAIPYAHRRNMLVGGSKGSICGNYAMEQADLLIAVGTRAVCQSDSSRTAYPGVRCVVNINADLEAATHYGRSIALVGDAAATLARLNAELARRGSSGSAGDSPWLAACAQQRRRWEALKAERYAMPILYDEKWGGHLLTQVVAVKVATDWARERDVVTFFDAGDVQANGLQIVEDDRWGRTYTDTGASYMGFAVSALLTTAMASEPFYGLAVSGDGSFTMSPQILIDGVAHGARGCILLMDNRRMAAISALQLEQYGVDYATDDQVAVDYLAWARAVEGVLVLDGGRSPRALRQALEQAHAYEGLSLIHLPVYYGPDPLGGLGAYGRWNVGNWAPETQALRHEIGL
jgi:3D-(3,5/4)-trihydroxycyclohexane-1,2-dione acylhydrolase (decyclizing)